MFRNLRGLEELTIDSFSNTRFGRGFEALVSLRLLNLSGKSAHCRIESLINDSLSVFTSSNIVSLDLSYCEDLSEIQTNAFAPLKKQLKHLTLDNAMSLGLHQSLSALYGLQGTNMSSLNFRNVDYTTSLYVTEDIQDRELFAETMQYLENICVSDLNLADNHILYIDIISFFSKNNTISKCLRRLDFQGNMLFGDYQIDILDNLYPLIIVNLEYIDISSFVCYREKSKMPRSIFSKMSSPRHWFLPRKLKTLIADAVNKDIEYNGDMKFNERNSFETLSVCNYDHVTLTGSIEGLVNLKTLKIAHNHNMTLSVSFFDTFPSLENLYLNDVSLPEGYFCQKGRRLFSKLTKLTLLDISGNDIRCLPKNIFKDNHKLQTLILSNNQFHTIPFSINHVPNLLTLKMDVNQIDVLSESTTSSLDIHARTNKHFYLDLSGNKLICVCGESVYFLSWLQGNDYLINREQYSCTIYNGSSVRVMDFNAERLWRHCSGQVWLLIAIPLFVFDILVFVSSFVVLKHKTQAIYFFKNLFRKCAMCPARTDYKFDICLCYADQDWRGACLDIAVHLERRYGYTVYLHDKNSIPGEPLADSIMYGINNSWKTVLLLTQNFIEDGWSWFTMHVAIRAVTWRTPYRLIVLRDPRRACEIPDCILCVVDEDRILPTPDQDVDESWEALVCLI
ncbi:toll-like receptor 4 [Gigantopelta aegis]|uniref:toll-like receptor 4 n=1 Tax=Gigantopelta aegis TaxID=1735272 RepID=UPI001B88CF50|nr:toll-like receptor 4 [Gigantopelta aegis]